MKHIFVLSVLGAAIVSVYAAPCWTLEDTCGAVPACSANELGQPYTQEDFHHTYCDGAYDCTWDTSKKKMLITWRIKYHWQPSPGVEKYCVGPPSTDWWANLCCLCSQAGITYEEPVEGRPAP